MRRNAEAERRAEWLAFVEGLASTPGQLQLIAKSLDLLVERVAAVEARLPAALHTIEEAAIILKRSVPSIRRDCRAGLLPVVRIGRSVRVDLSKLKSIGAADVATAAAAARAGLKAV